MNPTLSKIKQQYLSEVSRICEEAKMDMGQQDVINRLSSMIFDKGYEIGLNQGWAMEQEQRKMQRDGE